MAPPVKNLRCKKHPNQIVAIRDTSLYCLRCKGTPVKGTTSTVRKVKKHKGK